MSWWLVVKRWYVILLCAILCAGGLYYEKSKVYTVIPQTGDMTYIRVVQYEPVPGLTGNPDDKEIDITKGLNSWAYLADLETQMEADFEMNKLSAGWSKLSDSQKLKWLAGHFRIKSLAPGIYELTVQFAKKDVKNAEYIKANSKQLVDVYEDYVTTVSSQIAPDAKVKVVKEMQAVDQYEMVKQEAVEKKYAVIGAVLGALAGVVLVMVWEARKSLIRKRG